MKPSPATRRKPAAAPQRQSAGHPSGRPAAHLRLTPKERRLLADPDWVTEDEADIIYSLRHRRDPAIPFEEVAKELGYSLED